HDGPQPCATWLVAKQESMSTIVNQEDGWIWERIPPEQAELDPRGTTADLEHLATAAFLIQQAPELSEQLVMRLGTMAADQGLFQEAWGASPEDRWWVPIPSDAASSGCAYAVLDASALRPDEATIERVGRSWETWWGSFAATPLFEEMRLPCRRLHVLLVGGLVRQTALLARIEGRIREVLPGAELHTVPDGTQLGADGALIFLERLRQGLPTWRDLMPD